MLRNYLLIAFRNLWHNKFYALINILGLAISLTAALFILQYVQFEKSYDSFHKNGDQIYRFIMQINRPGSSEPPQQYANSDFVPIIKDRCPEIEECARIKRNPNENYILSYDPKDGSDPIEFLETKLYYVDASFMKMFSFPMLLGNASSLEEPHSIFLSENMAKKLFGSDLQKEDPIGKTLTLNGNENFMIQGVFKDIPENSHIKFEALLSLTTLASQLHYDSELQVDFPTYIQVKPGTNIKQFEAKLQQIQDEHYKDIFEWVNVDSAIVSLQPLKDVHLNSFGFKRESEVRGSASVVQSLLIAACFIVILAWVNYINLSTARAIKRAKEVGIRKVVGAGRLQLIKQFLLEAFLLNLVSIILALTLHQLLFSSYTNLVQKDIPLLSVFKNINILLGVGLILLFGTLLSGGYSAFVLSSFKAISTFKGKFYASKNGIWLRKGLIVFQFVISVVLIVGTLSVYQQLNFMKSYDKGFNQSQKLIVRAPQVKNEDYSKNYKGFKNDVKQISEVKEVTASYLTPGDPGGKGDQFVVSLKRPDELHLFSINNVDYNYLSTYQIQLMHGRGFSREFTTDKDAVVITEDVALQLGYDPVEIALEEKIEIGATGHNIEKHIIGIAKNVNLYSLQIERTGVIFMLENEENPRHSDILPFNYFTVDLAHLVKLEENLAHIESLYKRHFSGNPFDYFFLDDYFNAQYQSEEQFGKVFTAASSLAIFIACLGLFGLSAFMIKQRTKEIGIRKVLGAPVHSILLLLSSDYFKLISIAGLIALPIAYWSSQRWLESYMYRIPLSWWLFFVPIILVVIIALITVSIHTIKAAQANPAKSLSYE